MLLSGAEAEACAKERRSCAAQRIPANVLLVDLRIHTHTNTYWHMWQNMKIFGTSRVVKISDTKSQITILFTQITNFLRDLRLISWDPRLKMTISCGGSESHDWVLGLKWPLFLRDLRGHMPWFWDSKKHFFEGSEDYIHSSETQMTVCLMDLRVILHDSEMIFLRGLRVKCQRWSEI